MNVLVINCGSSSLKYQLIDSESEAVLAKGLCERIGLDGRLVYQKAGCDKEITEVAMPTHKQAIQLVLDALVNPTTGAIASLAEVGAVGHRLVHGAEKFTELFAQYLHDMAIVQAFALLNRQAMVQTILKGMKWHAEDQFSTIHNFIDRAHSILRKGAVSAQAGETLLIPINMRDGSLLCTGKGNPDWNFSAPHGAGRLCSRSEAKERFSVHEFKKQMEGIYTTSVGRDTIDECPMAYKDMASIVSQISETAEIRDVLRPVYNFKAGAEQA